MVAFEPKEEDVMKIYRDKKGYVQSIDVSDKSYVSLAKKLVKDIKYKTGEMRDIPVRYQISS